MYSHRTLQLNSNKYYFKATHMKMKMKLVLNSAFLCSIDFAHAQDDIRQKMLEIMALS